jgi:hypothetical protein
MCHTDPEGPVGGKEDMQDARLPRGERAHLAVLLQNEIEDPERSNLQLRSLSTTTKKQRNARTG